MTYRVPYACTFDELKAHQHKLQRYPTCCRGSIVGVNPTSGRISIIPATCKRWDCEPCAARKAAQYASRLFRANPTRHLVLTWDPKVNGNPHEALAIMKKALPKLIYWLRQGKPKKEGSRILRDFNDDIIYEWGPYQFEYCAIWERHRTGMPHVHIAQWGDYIPHTLIRQRWNQLTGARIVYIRDMANAVPDTHHWTKYLLKALPSTASAFYKLRLITFSQNYDRHGKTQTPKDNPHNMTWHFTHVSPDDALHALCIVFECDELRDDETMTTFDASHLDLPTSAGGLAALLQCTTQRYYLKVDPATATNAQLFTQQYIPNAIPRFDSLS